MTTVVFVHGINTRGRSYDLAYGHVRDALARRRPDVSLVRCSWGDDLGARLGAGGLSIPRYDQTKGLLDPVGLPAEEPDAWEWLAIDPLAELRLLELKPAPPPEEFDPRGGETSLLAIERWLIEIASPERLIALDQDAGLDAADWADSCRAVTLSPEFAAAASASSDDTESLYDAWARAVVATAIHDRPEVPLAFDAVVRDQAIAVLLNLATGGYRTRGTIRSWLGHALSVVGTRYALDRRGRYTDLIVPAVGDVLLYQSRGESIRQRIRESLPDEGPVVLLAHSLGGVACVDLLVQSELSQVELLITVGSQAPFFYEMDALPRLPFGDPLPPHFPRWLNIYDPRDFLSYVASPVFTPSARGVSDVRVDNRQPFVRTHSAYWANPQTWEAVAPALPERSPDA